MGIREVFEKYVREGEAGRSNTNELLRAIVEELESLKKRR
jgi:hypothetical protein